jgi:hypothetical protein
MANSYETWARSVDQRVFGGMDAAFSDMPRPLVALVAIASLLGMLVFTRYLVRLTAKQAPPTFEGLPFIGGILKFAKVGLLPLPCFCMHANATRLWLTCMDTLRSRCAGSNDSDAGGV